MMATNRIEVQQAGRRVIAWVRIQEGGINGIAFPFKDLLAESVGNNELSFLTTPWLLFCQRRDVHKDPSKSCSSFSHQVFKNECQCLRRIMPELQSENLCEM